MAEDLLEDMEQPEDNSSLSPDQAAAVAEDGKKASLFKRLPKPGKKMIIIGGAVILLLIILGVAAMFFLGGDDVPADDGAPVTAQGTDGQDSGAAPAIEFEDIVTLMPFKNIDLSTGSHMKAISLTVNLELTDHMFRKDVVTAEERLAKIVIAQARTKTWMMLRSPEGKIQFKYELLEQMNSNLPRVMIRNIYFTNFLMQ